MMVSFILAAIHSVTQMVAFMLIWAISKTANTRVVELGPAAIIAVPHLVFAIGMSFLVLVFFVKLLTIHTSPPRTHQVSQSTGLHLLIILGMAAVSAAHDADGTGKVPVPSGAGTGTVQGPLAAGARPTAPESMGPHAQAQDARLSGSSTDDRGSMTDQGPEGVLLVARVEGYVDSHPTTEIPHPAPQTLDPSP
jgi:hypothetical protein